ncbi:MAG: nucleoside 2-deoxyribosyltransferase [Anaerolineae bacterium]|nr:nucleoside 2-deoxyribosyltransferase [Anaerolineae bacterium]
MNLYFAASIRGGRERQAVYAALVDHLTAQGHTVLTEHVASATLEDDERDQTDREIYAQDIRWLDQAGAVIAEVSVPSLGVGYEIGYALHVRDIPVLCLCDASVTLSAMLTGNPHPRLQMCCYHELAGALAALDRFTTQAAGSAAEPF